MDPEEELIEYESKSLERHLDDYKKCLLRAKEIGHTSQVDFLEKTIADLEKQIRETPQLDQVHARYAAQREAIRAYTLGMNLISNVRQTEGREQLLKFLELVKSEGCELYAPLQAEAHHKIALAFGFNMTVDVDNLSIPDLERAINETRLASERCEGYAQEKLLALTDLKKDLLNGLKEVQKEQMQASLYASEDLASEADKAYKLGQDLIHKDKHEEGRKELVRFLQMMPLSQEHREPTVRETLAWSYLRTKDFDCALKEVRIAKEYYETKTGYGGKKLTDEQTYKFLCQLEELIKQESKKDL